MGYHVYLIREKDGIKSPITKEEIIGLISSDASLSYDDMADYLNIKKTSLYGSPVYFIYQNGELYVKNPTDIQLEEFIKLAEILRGRVRGENYETYRSSSETYVHENDVEKASNFLNEIKKNKSNKRRKNFLLRSGFILAGIIIGAAIGIIKRM